MTTAAMIDAAASLTGMAAHTPFKPKNKGRMASMGSRMISCRLRERKMLTFTLPIHWKKLVTTIW